ncbi:hypothetical protein [Pseudoroseicyclus aestuarii]|uniref:Transmembrane protein n=1 Tax=Pseudoroseicyclus aestuarii TaxID=1795041 RepID=A0A318SUI0_9RHOB|nr:hypothetical protein [Pseudoroseicyclus aestuarii]PYE85561.1 hypothetical protein DFP88_101229 [Pseudoroseicyclus aestuarii]
MTDDATDDAPRHQEEQKAFAEEADSLLAITIAPLIWCAHFLVCYCGVAIYCAKWQQAFSLGVLRAGLIGATVLALAGIALIGWFAFRRWDVRTSGDWVHERGISEDRHRFLGHAAFLLALISFIAVCYVTLPLIFIGSCA